MRTVSATVCLALLLIVAKLPASAQRLQPQDALDSPGFVAFFNNEYDDAITYFSGQTTAHPDDPAAYNHLAEAILYQELYRNGSLESQLVSGNNAFLRREKMSVQPDTRKRFNDCLAKSLALSAAALKVNSKNVEALYEEGSAHAMRATYFFLVEKAWVEALKEASAARRANEAVLDLNPQFIDAHLILGVYSYVVGSLPFYMRALGAVGGFHGDKPGGLQQIQLVATRGIADKYDAQVLLAVLYRREHKAQLAIPLLQKLAQLFPRNNLFRFEQVQMYSDLGDKASALSVLNTIEQLRQTGARGYAAIPPNKIRFVAGNLYFWYDDLPKALENFRAVTEGSATLDLNAALIGWLRLGQTLDLLNKHSEAVGAYRKAMDLAPGSEAASEAKGYLSTPYHRRVNPH